MMTPTVTENRRQREPRRRAVELARYSVPEGERVLYGQRVDGVVSFLPGSDGVVDQLRSRSEDATCRFRQASRSGERPTCYEINDRTPICVCRTVVRRHERGDGSSFWSHRRAGRASEVFGELRRPCALWPAGLWGCEGDLCPQVPGGRAYVVERGLEEEGANACAALDALIADYLRQAAVLDEVPMAVSVVLKWRAERSVGRRASYESTYESSGDRRPEHLPVRSDATGASMPSLTLPPTYRAPSGSRAGSAPDRCRRSDRARRSRACGRGRWRGRWSSPEGVERLPAGRLVRPSQRLGDPGAREAASLVRGEHHPADLVDRFALPLVIPEGHRAGSGAVLGDDDEHPVVIGFHRGDVALELGRHILLEGRRPAQPTSVDPCRCARRVGGLRA